ncbi:MAG: TolB family protein [Deltaproteobacteria bacterium]|nr:TolB family protein [Deltaproteobacteria bacterium]
MRKIANAVFATLTVGIALVAMPASAQVGKSVAKTATPTATPLATIEATPTSPLPTATPYPGLRAGFETNFQVMNPLSLSGRIAFSTPIDGYERILVLDLNSGRVRKLIDGPGNNYFPTWSHDGRKITFTSDRDGNKEIYVADWDGTNQIRLTNNAVTDDNPTWTPDDKHVVYYSDATASDESDSNLFMVSVSGGTPAQLTKFTGRNTTPRVSPDGSLISYSTNRFWPGWDVCIWNLHSKAESCPLQGKASFCRGAWSPSGKLFAYSFGLLDAVEVGYITSGTKDKKPLTEMGGKEYDPVWSPSESLVAFVGDSEVRGTFNLYVVDLQRKVTPLLKSTYSIRYPTWSGTKTFELEAERLRQAEVKEDQEEQRARELLASTPPQSPAPEVAGH